MNINPSDGEKRRFSRVPFVNKITLSYDGENWYGTVVDISFNGLLVTGDNPPFNADSNIEAVIHFDNGIDIHSHLELIHTHDEFYGLQFTDIDSDSLTHLRKLIAFNLGDEGACQRELMSLFSYHQ